MLTIMIIMVIMVGSMIMTMMMMTQMTMLVRVMMTMLKMEIGPRAEMSCSLAVPDPGGSDSRLAGVPAFWFTHTQQR